jgi:hypothetical protein
VEVLVFFTCGTAYALLFDMVSAFDLAPDQLAVKNSRKTVYV